MDSSKVLCAFADVWRIARKSFEVSGSGALTVSTSGLTAIGGSTPDTVLYVVKCTTSSCESGEIVEVDDDGNTDTTGSGNTLDSKVVISSPATGWYAAIVVAYAAGRHGVGTIAWSQVGGSSDTWNNEVFAGWHIKDKSVKDNDVLLVGKNPGAASMTTSGYEKYHDSVMFVASTMSVDCVNCGKFQFSDDLAFGSGATTRLTRMTIGSALGAPANARVVVGVYTNGTVGSSEYYRMHARFAHIRRHTGQSGNWTGAAQEDKDADGLTTEIEEQLGCCDAVATDADPSGGTDVIVAGYTCDAARDWVNSQVDAFDSSGTSCSSSSSQAKCWRASDSDHDGIDDAAELFAVAVGCDAGPAGPFRHATNCAKPSPVFGLCDSGDWCAVEPSSSSELNSPFFEHEPTAYDVYVLADFTKSSVFAESATAHMLSSGEQSQLTGIWTTDAGRCWDGTTGSCPTGDLKYRVQMHAFPSSGLAVGDDRFQEELPTASGATFSRSHSYAQFAGAMRYAGVASYGLAIHGSLNRGEAAWRHFLWEQGLGQAGQARYPFSHEAGHTLGLVTSPSGGHYLAGNDPNCCGDGAACDFYAAACDTAVAQSPFPSTPMSYEHLTAFPTQPQPPESTTAYSVCARTNLRFSKGLLGVVDEGNLDETMATSTGWAEWQLRYLAQQAFCYDAFNDGVPATPFALRNGNGVASSGPYCDVDGNGAATTCYFNWRNRSSATSTSALNSGAAPIDVTAGRWTGASSSNLDQLRDVNEWGEMIALGRRRLAEEMQANMCLFASTFNGAIVTDDYCGWQETITNSNVSASKVNYPTSGCFVNGDCTSNSCKFDTCTQGADCRDANQGCGGGVCNCADDDDCFSGQCVDSKCVTVWGGCGCANDGQCGGAGGFCVQADSQCRGYMAADNALCPTNGPDPNQPFSLLESADFNGSDARLKLQGGANSRLEALSGSYENAYTLKFDFRFDGFQGSETSHVLCKSGAFSATIVSASGQIQVQVQAGSHTALVYSGLQKGRWYRGVWSARSGTGGEHFLWLRKWGVRGGWYETGTSAADCVYQAWDSSLPSTGDVWIGHDGGSDSALYFNGRADNVSLVNYLYTARPASCTPQ